MQNHGTVYGPTPTAGKIRQGMSFDGTNDSISIGASDILNLTGDLTISAWIYPESFGEGGYGRIFEHRLDPGGYSFLMNAFNGGIRLSAIAGANIDSNSNVITLHTWQHVVATRSGTTVTLYVNGVSAGSGIMNTIGGTSGPSAIGGESNGPDRLFDGLLDDLRIYSRALSPDEVSRLYESNNRSSSVTILPNDSNKTTTINSSQNNHLTDGLVGLWSFNGPDISGTTAYDRSGNNNNGTIYGATPTIGKVGQGMSFNGTSNHITAPDSESLSVTNAITISAWIKPVETKFHPIVDKWYDYSGYSSPARSYSIGYNSTGTGKINVSISSQGYNCNDSDGAWQYDCSNSNGSWMFSNSVVPLNTWTHVATTYGNGYIRIYINGVLDKELATYSSSIFNNNDEVEIGRDYSGTQYFSGSMDEVRIYNRALSGQEIRELYNMGGGQ